MAIIPVAWSYRYSSPTKDLKKSKKSILNKNPWGGQQTIMDNQRFEEEMKGKLHTQGRRKEDKIDDGTY